MAADTDYHIDPQSGRAVLTKKQNTGGICFMKMRSVVPMRIAKIGYIITSVLFCIVGILFIAMPEISTRIVGVGIGAVTIVFGIAKLIGYFSKDLYRLAFQFDLEFGIIMVVLGTVVLFHPENLMAFIAAAFGIAILFDGLFKTQIALDAKRFGIKDWWLILSLAILAGIVGVALVFDSAFGAGVLSVLMGAALFSEGLLNLYTVIRTVLIVKNQAPDFVETDTFDFFEKDR